MRFSRLLNFLTLPPRVLARWLAALFGSLRWTPPPWTGAVFRHRRLALMIMLLVSGATYAGVQWYHAREANRPRPRELVATRKVTATVANPSAPTWVKETGKAMPAPVTFSFDTDAAPLNESENSRALAVPPAILRPGADGEWKWAGPRQLVFQPAQVLPAAQKFTATFCADALAAHTELVTRDLQFETPPFAVQVTQSEFFTDPVDPAHHQAVITVEFNYPIDAGEVGRRMTVDAISGKRLFKAGSSAETRVSPQYGWRIFLRSPVVEIPQAEDFIRFRLPADFTASCGGAPLGKEFVEKVTVPTRETGFRVAGARAELVPDADENPQQFLMVETSRPMKLADFARAVEAWELPERDDEVLWDPSNVTPDVLARSQRVALHHVAGDEDAPFGKTASFRMDPRSPGTLWVRVPAGFAASGGFVLGSEFASRVEVPAFPKEVAVLGEGGILALTGERKLTVKSRGFDHLRFTLGRVPSSQINHLVSQTGGDFQSPHFRGAFGVSNIARFQRTVIDVARDNDHEANYSAFDLGPELGRTLAGEPGSARGLFFLETEGVRPRTEDDGAPPADDPDPKWIPLGANGEAAEGDDEDDAEPCGDKRFLLVTDLGLIVKRNADGTRQVFVVSFRDRVPVADVAVSVIARNGEILAEAAADAQGHARLPALDGLKREKKPVAIVARSKDDLAFIPWNRGDRAVELSRFDIDGLPASESGKLDAFLFTERGIYRPGDPIHVGAIIRRRDWQAGLAGVRVKAILTDTKQSPAAQAEATLPADGFVEFNLPTAESAPAGVWRVELQRPLEDEEVEHLGYIYIRVEEFQPDRLKLAAKFNQGGKRGWLPPRDLALETEAHTLFDLPAADRRITGKVQLAPMPPRFAEWDGWNFHLSDSEFTANNTIDLPEQKTDANGRARFRLDALPHTAQLLRVDASFEVFEADSGRGARAAVSTLVSPSERLIGWKAEADLGYLTRDVPQAVKLVAISPQLEPVAAPELKRVLIESRYVSVLAKQENGNLSYISKERDHELEQADGSLPSGESILQLPVGRAGRFRYEWREADGTVVCSLPFNVVGPSEANRSLQRDTELELALPKREWRPGEKLEVAIRAPYAGAGLITIERERVLAWRWFQADTANSVQHITVPEGIEGGAYVHVAIARRLDAPEIFMNPLSVGVARFKVALDRRKLALTLDAPKLAKPGTPLKIALRSTKPARAAVWAVDDGIHRVTAYRAPQPLPAFFRVPALEVRTWQLLDLLLPEYSIAKKSRAFGGDGDEPPELKLGLNPFKRKRNAPVVYWSGIVECGPEARELTWDIPDYFAGRLNMMAVAVTGDAIGTSETFTTVKGPFVLTPNAPLFAAPGDEFIASLTVANQLEPASDRITIGATATENLEILEAPQPQQQIAPNTEATVRFRVRVKEPLGNGELRFKASAGTEEVALTHSLSVRPAMPAISRIESGWFREDRQEVNVGQPLFAQFAKREAILSSTPTALAGGLNAYLREFPHGCTEQTTSRAFPHLLVKAEEPGRAEAQRAVDEACRILSQRQRADGGFGYWVSQDGGDGLDPLTVYVAHFLTEARDAGFQIPDHLLAGTMRRVKTMAAISVKSRPDANVQAAGIYLLTRHGEVTTNYALNLSDTLRREHAANWLRDPSAAWLAGTWMLLKMEKEARALLQEHREALAKPDDDKKRPSSFFENRLSTIAQSFTVICRHFPDVAGTLGYDDLRPITDPVARGHFDTYSASWSVLALRSYAVLAKTSGPALSFAEMAGGAWRDLPEFSPGHARFSGEATRIAFRRAERPGGANLGAWYQMLEFGFPRATPDRPATRGLEVFQEIIGPDEKPVTIVSVGDDVRVRVRARNVNDLPQRHIALTLLQPAGFENAPNGLQPGLHGLPGATYVDAREDRNLLFFDLAPGASRTFEWKARATAAGTFVVPPAFAEAMYDRAVSGHGATSRITVNLR